MKHFLSASIVKNITIAIEQTGLNSADFLAKANIGSEDIDDANAFVDIEKVCHLYTQIENAGYLDFGVRLAEQSGTGLSVAGYIAVNSASVEEALNNAIRYFGLVSNVSTLSLEAHKEQAEFIWTYAETGNPIPRSMIDGGVFSWFRMLDKALGGQLAIKAAYFQYEQPTDMSDYYRVLRAPVHFSQSSNAIIFDAALLSKPLLGSDPTLKMLMEQHALALHERIPKSSAFLGEFSTVMQTNLATGNSSMESAAKCLNMSSKTLQRRLKAENTVFTDELSTLRKNLSISYLRQSFSLIEITFLLGYSEQSVFNRAFKAWFGVSPLEYIKAENLT